MLATGRTILYALWFAAAVSACGGAAPLMHPAHALDAGQVTVGAGFSGQTAVSPLSEGVAKTSEQVLDDAAFSAGLAPWVGARFGFDGAYEAGLTYTGRTLRLDARRAFDLGLPTLSVGLGASGVLPKRRDELGIRVGGGGGDLPILLGFRSRGDVYSIWLGARGGFELLGGRRVIESDPGSPTSEELIEDISAWHAQVGGLVGVRVGFRYIFAVFELGAAMHFASGEIGAESADIRQFGLSPAGALVLRF